MRHASPSSRSRSRLLPWGVAAVLGLLGGSARGDDWSSLGLGDTRSRLSAETSGGRFDAGVWRHEWKTAEDIAKRAIVATPAIADGFVAFATQRNVVRLLAESDGRLIWETPAGGAVVASPAIWRGLVFVVGVNQRVMALRVADGTVAWERQLGALGYASPVVSGGSLFVASAAPVARVWRLDPSNGRVTWQAGEGTLDNSALASVAIADGHVLVGELDGRCHSFALADGKLQWTAVTGGRVGLSSPLVVGDRVFLLPGGDKAQLHAVDLATGAAIAGWPIDLPMPDPDPALGPSRARTFLTSSPAGGAAGIALAVRADDRFGTTDTGEAASFLAQEQLFLVDPSSGKITWSIANGRLAGADLNQLPIHELLPTPALYRSTTGELLIAASSSLSPSLRVLAANGDERWTTPLTLPTRGSPVLANGRLVVATDGATVESFLSGSNQPPLAPSAGFAPAGNLQAFKTNLTWGPAVDPEGQPVTFTVRVDDDGEVLRDWDLEVTLPADTQSLELPALVAETTYTFAVRARDPQGAYSAWSALQSFHAIASPSVTVDGQASASLPDAAAVARAGAVIRLGAGRFDLTATLHLPAGVSLVGAGPHLTTLNAAGLAVGVAPGSGSELRQLTVASAVIGVAVDGATGVHLRNVILRDNSDAGLAVEATGTADLVSGTLVRNGNAVRAAGATVVRNALVTANFIGIAASAPGIVTTAYNDVYDNRSENYHGATTATTDLALAVTFASADPNDLRFAAVQPTTDKGDPADDFALEPAPNGARINIGAFGNTEFAELSALTGTDPGPPPVTTPGTGGTGGGSDPGATTPAPSHDDGGCGYAGTGPENGANVLFVIMLATAWLRRRGRH